MFVEVNKNQQIITMELLKIVCLFCLDSGTLKLQSTDNKEAPM